PSATTACAGRSCPGGGASRGSMARSSSTARATRSRRTRPSALEAAEVDHVRDRVAAPRRTRRARAHGDPDVVEARVEDVAPVRRAPNPRRRDRRRRPAGPPAPAEVLADVPAAVALQVAAVEDPVEEGRPGRLVVREEAAIDPRP